MTNFQKQSLNNTICTCNTPYFFFVLFSHLFITLFVHFASLTGKCEELWYNSIIMTEIWHTGIPGLWTQVLDAGLGTLDSGLGTLDSGRWPLDADFKDGPDIMLSELACFSETKWYFNYSTNQKQGWQFLYYREILHKETKHNEPFKSVLKKSYSLGQNSAKNNNCDAFL